MIYLTSYIVFLIKNIYGTLKRIKNVLFTENQHHLPKPVGRPEAHGPAQARPINSSGQSGRAIKLTVNFGLLFLEPKPAQKLGPLGRPNGPGPN